jgi:hypothetical protein
MDRWGRRGTLWVRLPTAGRIKTIFISFRGPQAHPNRPGLSYASIFVTTLPATSVRRKSRPMWWKVRRV